MPRNSSGVYQLPAGNPVVTGTLIESVWANSTMSDMAQALTDSLDRFGRSTMAAPFLANDGTVSAPGIAFGAEASTGLFRKSAKVMGISAGGMEVATFSQLGVTFPKGIVGSIALSAGGSITAPGSSSGSWTVGPASAGGGIRIDGTQAAAAVVDLSPIPSDGTSAATVRLFRNTTTTGAATFQILRPDGTGGTADHLFATGAAGVSSLARFGGRVLIGTTSDNTIDTAQIALSARVRNGASGVGSNAAASVGYDEFVIEGNSDVGMSFLSSNTAWCGIAWGDPQGLRQGILTYNHNLDQMSIGAAAATNLILDVAYSRSLVPFYAPDGTAAAPSFGFMTQATWGMFRVPAIGIGFTVSGVEAARIAAAGMTLSAGVASLMHNDTTSSLNIVASASFIDATARIELYDSAHATLARRAFIRGREIIFTDSTAANEKARFSTNTDRTEFLLGRTAAIYTSAGRSLIEIDGTAGSMFGLHYNGTRVGYAYAFSTGEFRFSTGVAAMAMTFCQNAVEVFRIDTDSTFQYTAPTIGQQEVGFRGMPLQTKVAAYTVRSLDRGCCINQTAVGNVILAAVFSAGDVVSIWNNSGANIAIVPSSVVTYKFGVGGGLISSNSTSRTLQKNGWAVLVFDAANSCRLSGEGLL